MAEAKPTVAFQVDTSAATGLFEWDSVTGEGRFEIVTSEEERQETLSALQPVIAQAPDWWQRNLAPQLVSGALLVWKISPIRSFGRRYSPPEDVARRTDGGI
jgi:nitroimidazol reductase NimA-like FMN-containing flavoprotein (pyridoxamine 5'-phosphate oxidase superfamily)